MGLDPARYRRTSRHERWIAGICTVNSPRTHLHKRLAKTIGWALEKITQISVFRSASEHLALLLAGKGYQGLGSCVCGFGGNLIRPKNTRHQTSDCAQAPAATNDDE